MSDINGLHDSLGATYYDWMRDIRAANESANRIADALIIDHRLSTVYTVAQFSVDADEPSVDR